MFGKVYFVTFNLAELKSRVHNRIENLLYKSVVQICASDAVNSSMKCLHNHFFCQKMVNVQIQFCKTWHFIEFKETKKIYF